MRSSAKSGAAAMSADVDDKNKRPDLDLSFLGQKPSRAAQTPNLNKPSERPDDNAPRASNQQDAKTLTISRDISLKGDIAECDSLIVEGHIEGTLDSARALEVSRGGRFVGSAKAETATISGRFDGDLQVVSALRITASGKVTGTVSYGRLEIEQGGEVLGDISVYG